MAKSKDKDEKMDHIADEKMDHTTKVSFWCLGIIVIILLFYFIAQMIDKAEELEDIDLSSNTINI